MKDIAIYGAGGLGREVACLLKHINEAQGHKWNLIGFFDDGKRAGEDVAHFGKTLGGMAELNSWPQPLCVALSFGSPKALRAVSGRITNPNIDFPNIIAPDYYIADPSTFSIGKGNIIVGWCTASTNTVIGDFNLLNGSVVFGHDVRVGDCNVFMPGTRISGGVAIGNECLFGAGCFVKQQLGIPDRVTVGPLSPLLTNPKPDSLYMGNPAKRIKF